MHKERSAGKYQNVSNIDGLILKLFVLQESNNCLIVSVSVGVRMSALPVCIRCIAPGARHRSRSKKCMDPQPSHRMPRFDRRTPRSLTITYPCVGMAGCRSCSKVVFGNAVKSLSPTTSSICEHYWCVIVLGTS